MIAEAQYIVEGILFLGVWMFFYHVVLSNSPLHSFKRFYLLFGLVASFILPLVPTLISWELQIDTLISPVSSIPIVTEQFSQEAFQKTSVGYHMKLWPFLYGAVVLILLVRSSVDFVFLYWKSKTFPIVKNNGFKYVFTDQKQGPYVFLNLIFVNKFDFQNQNIPVQVLIHEQAHVNQKHSLDLILVECCQALLWLNPFVWMCGKSVRLNHEYICDDLAISKAGSLKSYFNLLLDETKISTFPSRYSNAFGFLQTKKRIKMINKRMNRIQRYTKFMSTFLFSVVLVIAMTTDINGQSQKHDKNQAEYYEQASFVVVDNEGMPHSKSYQDLTKKELKLLPVPSNQDWRKGPLAVGSTVHIDRNGEVSIDRKIILPQFEPRPVAPPMPEAPSVPEVAPEPPQPPTAPEPPLPPTAEPKEMPLPPLPPKEKKK